MADHRDGDHTRTDKVQREDQLAAIVDGEVGGARGHRWVLVCFSLCLHTASSLSSKHPPTGRYLLVAASRIPRLKYSIISEKSR